jgi:hypothetical protein
MPEGPALYVRRISAKRHGAPKAFAKKCADHELGWIALAGLWQDVRNGRPTSKMINSIKTIHAYGDALEAEGVDVYVWGYPWQGREAQFVTAMLEAAAPFGRVLLDPELGANPSRQRMGVEKKRANKHATDLVRLFAEAPGHLKVLGLSTFGTGWRIGWFPLLAFTRALIQYFGGRCFIGGQTYTDDGVIDRSVGDMQAVIEKAGGSLILPYPVGGLVPLENGCEVVPNFGAYTWQAPSGKRGKKTRGAKAKPKTVAELRAHLYEFIDDDEPIDSLIGWAENFMNDALWEELARFANLMERGACCLPRT